MEQENFQPPKQTQKVKSKYFMAASIIFLVLGISGFFLNYTIGGCQYADISFSFDEVSPVGTEVKSDRCSSIEINGSSGAMLLGDYDLEITNSSHPESFSPNSVFGKTNFILKLSEAGTEDIEIKGTTRFNLSGIIQGLYIYFFVIFIILIIIYKWLKNKEKKTTK